jgi:MFS family permease
MSATAFAAPDSSVPPGPTAPLPGARTALALLLTINLFNYIDRQVLAAVEPDIRRTLFPDAVEAPADAPKEVKEEAKERIAAAKGRTGLLSSAFLVTYMLTAPLFGWLADRMSRWFLVAIGVTLWSMASAASGVDWALGLAAGYWLLLATRCLVGIGEAVYGPVAPTVIADLFPVRVRGQKMAWFYAAIPVGGALGYAWGALMRAPLFGHPPLGWRWAFYLLAPPGVLLGILCCLMPEPPRGQADALGGTAPRALHRRDYLVLVRTPSYVWNTLGMTAMTFAIGGLAFWMPAYLEERQATPLFGLEPLMIFGAITALTGLLATLAGGWVGDRLRKRFPGSYFLVSGTAMLIGFPMLVAMVYSPFPLAWVFIFCAVFCLFFNTGPTNTILANVTHPALRATAFALNILVIHLFGDVLSPPLIGPIAGYWGSDTAFVVISVTVLVGGVCWLWGARYLAEDTALAPRRLG